MPDGSALWPEHSRWWSHRWRGGNTHFAKSQWDKSGLSKHQFDLIQKVSVLHIVWGYNHLADVLGKCTKALAWDKYLLNDIQTDFADCELAYSNIKGPARMFRHKWNGALRDSEKQKGFRIHPTQKPVALMRWCIDQAGRPNNIIDPFMGSGSTAIACIEKGIPFVGIEREADYFKAACARIEAANNQGRLALGI